MALAFLLDENVPARLWRAIQRHNSSSRETLDVMRGGEPADLPLSADDAAILLWAEREDRILVTEDKQTLAGHLERHLQSGRHSPGVFMIRPGTRVGELLDFLVLAAYASQSEEWRDRVVFIP